MQSVAQANSRAALEDLIKTYKDRENKISQDIESMRAKNAEVVRKNMFLYNKYNSLKDILEDVTPDKSKIPLDLPKESDIKVTASELDLKRESELRSLRGVVKQMQSEMSAQQDKNVQVSETYRQMVHEMEGRMKELAGKLNIVSSEKERLEKEKLDERDGETLKQIEDMQQNIIEQLSSIKPGRVGTGSDEGAGGGMSQKERDELHELRRFKRKQQKANKGSSGKENTVDENAKKEVFALKAEVSRLQRKVEMQAVAGGEGSNIGAGDAGSEETLRAALQTKERRIAELETKHIRLEEELANYKTYMDQTVRKYKRTIKDLKKE